MDVPSWEEVLGTLADYASVRYTNVAFLMLLLYDHALTFELEVSRIWTLRWRLPKILFLINRYLIPPMLLFNGLTPGMKLGKPCVFVIKWTAWPTIISLATVDVILILRVLAIYAHDKNIKWFLIILFACSLTAWLTLALLTLFGTTALPSNSLFTGCLYTAPSYYFAAWIPPIVFESSIIVLTIYKTLKYDKISPPLHVLARDSILYFLIIFLMLIANVFIARFGEGFIGALLIVPCCVVACLAASRMTMNIREFTMQTDIDINITEFELETIHFRQGDASTQTESIMWTRIY